MANGAFIVSQDKNNRRDIRFEIKKGVEPGAVPEDQATLRDDVDSALTVLRNIFPGDDPRFKEYFRPLLSLAQLGLAAEPAFTDLAHRALIALKADVVSREGGRIKNEYMKKLGIAAVLMVAGALLVASGICFLPPEYQPLYSFCFLWVGCMAGVWLSFGARRTFMRFKDLHVAEEDSLEPFLRLVFSGLLTITVGLFFSTELLVVQLGNISTSQFDESAEIALLIGILSGFSEKALPSKIAKQASSLLEPVG